MWQCNTKWSSSAKLYVCLIYLFTLFSVDKRKPISSVKLYCTVCRLSSSRNVHFSLCKNLSCWRLNLRKTDTIDSTVLTTHLLNFSNFFFFRIQSFRIEFPSIPASSDQIRISTMTVYMGKPGRRLDSILKWEYFYYDDCLVLTRKNKVIKK